MYLAMDCGQNLGLAFWRASPQKIPTPDEVVCIKQPKMDDWALSLSFMDAEMRKWFRNRDVSGAKAFIEYPAYFQTPKGRVSARSGALIKLTILTGFLAHSVTDDFFDEIQFIGVSDWKGQLPKILVEKRLKAFFQKIHSKSANRRFDKPVSESKWNSHIWDAIGVGLWATETFDVKTCGRSK